MLKFFAEKLTANKVYIKGTFTAYFLKY